MRRRMKRMEDGGNDFQQQPPPKNKVQTLPPVTVRQTLRNGVSRDTSKQNGSIYNPYTRADILTKNSDGITKALTGTQATYEDSLRAYNSYLKFKNWIDNHPNYVDGAPGNDPKLEDEYNNIQEENAEGNWGPNGDNVHGLRISQILHPFPNAPEQELWRFDKPIRSKTAIRSKPVFVPPPMYPSQIQSAGPFQPSLNPIQGSPFRQGPLAGQGTTNFSFTGRDDNGQQSTRYFSDLDTWRNATDRMGYANRQVAGDNSSAQATGYQFRSGGKTINTSQYPKHSMKKSLRGNKMKSGGNHWDPQLGSYMSNIYNSGGGVPPGYPYAGYNDSQRHMFSGMMAYGGSSGPGQINSANAGATQTSSNSDFSAIDRINAILSGRSRNVGMSDPSTNPLAMQAYLWRQQNPGRSSDQMVSSFYGRPVASGNAMDSLRQRFGNMGYGANAVFNDTPDMTVRRMGGITAKQKYGSAPADELAEDWKDVFYNNPDYKKGGKHWIQGAVNPAHKGYCTPMSKPTCTGHRKALAKMFKSKHGFHKKEDGGYLQGMEMAEGGVPNPYPAPYGYPGSFSPAGSMVDQNQWAMLGDDSSLSPNYRKSANSLNAIQGSPLVPSGGTSVNLPGIRKTTSTSRTSFGTPNVNNLSWLLPLNAGLGIASQANQYNQNQQYRMRNMNNPLQNLGYANGRPDEVKYGYQPYRNGGETMPMMGKRMTMWGQGGAANQFRPYMLHQGRFDTGGDLMDQWDAEDFQDQQQQQQQAPPQEQDSFEPDDWDMRRKSDLSDDDDYEAALQIALQNNPYL